MLKDRFAEGGSIVWPPLPSLGSERDGKKHRSGKPRKESEDKETPEEMIRSLQGIFCKGRYRSWTVRQG